MRVSRAHYRNGHLKYEHLHQEDKLHGVAKGRHPNGLLSYESPFQEGKQHGVARGWHSSGQLEYKDYYLYGDRVTEEEFRKHELIEKLAGL